jgi:DHA1 family tetracycline resistance protein-like MFS transporter
MLRSALPDRIHRLITMHEPDTISRSEMSTPADAPVPVNRSALLIVFLVVFIDLLGFGIVLPLLPRFAESYVQPIVGGGEDNPMVGFIVGLLMSSFSLMQFLFAPFWGRISDRVGRRPILLLGLCGSVVFYALFGYALSLPAENASLVLVLLFVARIGAGIAGATISTAQAVIADCTPPDKRKHGMAMIGAAFGIGFTFGPLFGYGSLLWFQDNHEVIGYTAAALSLVALLLGLRLLPETRRLQSASALRRQILNLSALKWTLTSLAIWPVVLTFFLATLGFGAFEVTLALFLRDAMGFGLKPTLLMFAYVGFVLALTQGFLYRRLAKRVSEITFMAVGILLMAIGVAGLGWISYLAFGGPHAQPIGTVIVGATGYLALREATSPPVAWLFVALAAAVIGYAFLTPSAQALVSRRTDADKQGEVLGVNQSAASMARILGPIFGVTLYKASATHLLPYICGSALLLVMLPLVPLMRRGAKDAP